MNESYLKWCSKLYCPTKKCLTAEKMTVKLERRGTICDTLLFNCSPFWNIQTTYVLIWFCLCIFSTSPSKQTLVQAGTWSCGENFCSSLWSHSFVTQSLSEKIYPSRLVCHARYPKALLEGGHDCRLAVRRLWHLKAVSRLMSAHETLMKWVFPKRWHSREQRKTIISRIKARGSKT